MWIAQTTSVCVSNWHYWPLSTSQYILKVFKRSQQAFFHALSSCCIKCQKSSELFFLRFSHVMCCFCSFVRKKLPSGHGRYHLRIIPYHDAHFSSPLTGVINVEMEMEQRLYVEVRAEGVDERQVATVLDSCWATPVNNASYPIQQNLIKNK